jgi:hypothetical protein
MTANSLLVLAFLVLRGGIEPSTRGFSVDFDPSKVNYSEPRRRWNLMGFHGLALDEGTEVKRVKTGEENRVLLPKCCPRKED